MASAALRPCSFNLGPPSLWIPVARTASQSRRKKLNDHVVIATIFFDAGQLTLLSFSLLLRVFCILHLKHAATMQRMGQTGEEHPPCCHSHPGMPWLLLHHCASAGRRRCACAEPGSSKDGFVYLRLGQSPMPLKGGLLRLAGVVQVYLLVGLHKLLVVIDRRLIRAGFSSVLPDRSEL